MLPARSQITKMVVDVEKLDYYYVVACHAAVTLGVCDMCRHA